MHRGIDHHLHMPNYLNLFKICGGQPCLLLTSEYTLSHGCKFELICSFLLFTTASPIVSSVHWCWSIEGKKLIFNLFHLIFLSAFRLFPAWLQSLWLLPAPSAVWSDLIFRQPITLARFLVGPISRAMSRKRSTQRSWGTISVKSMCHLNFTILTVGKRPSVPLLSLVSCTHHCLMLLLLLLFTLIQEIEIVTLIFFFPEVPENLFAQIKFMQFSRRMMYFWTDDHKYKSNAWDI